MSPLRTALRSLKNKAKRFAKAREGVAAVEFALVMPLMLTLYLGSTELTQLINVDERITNIAGTVGDLVARSDGQVTASDLTDYFQAAQAIIAPFSGTSLKQVVSLVYVNSSGVTTVKWSQAYNGGTARTVGQPYPSSPGIATSMIAISKSNYVIVSEASYSYQPLLGLFFRSPFTLYHQNYYLPRYPGIICYNTSTCS
ncbi:MAG: TadE/TadG family type IV pilus assembly protein [Devosia sp.]